MKVNALYCSLAVLGGPEVGELSLIAGLHSGSAWGPGSGADLAVLVGVLEALHESEDLLDVSADGEVIHGDVSQDALVVDDVGGAEGNTSIVSVLNKAAVLSSYLLGNVGNEGDVHLAEATNLLVLLGVLHVSEVGVDGGTDDLATDLSEGLCLVTELNDLSRADEGEVKRPEEEDDVLA